MIVDQSSCLKIEEKSFINVTFSCMIFICLAIFTSSNPTYRA